jgi:hypothetical protein
MESLAALAAPGGGMKSVFLGLAFFAATQASAATWNYSRELTVANPGAQAKDAVLEVILKSDFSYAKAKADGSDLRFSLGNGAEGEPRIPFWIEQWNANGVSRIWVKVPALPAAGSKLYLYYGNAAAAAASNGAETFLFFDDFQDGSFAGKWTNLSIGTAVEKGGTLQLTENDGQEGIITTAFTLTGKMIVRALYQRGRGDGHWTRGGIGGWNNWFCYGDHTDFAGAGTNYVMMYDSASMANVDANPLKKVTNKTITDQWRRIAYWYDGAKLTGMQDSTTVDWTVANAPSKLAIRTLDNDASDNYEFITVSDLLDPDLKVTVGAEGNAATALASVPSARHGHGAGAPALGSRVRADGRKAEARPATPQFRP